MPSPDTLLTDLNDSVGTGRSSTSGTQQRAVVPSTGPGLVTEHHGVPGSGDFHERREYTSPDQRTHVVEERFEKTARGDAGVSVPMLPGPVVMHVRFSLRSCRFSVSLRGCRRAATGLAGPPHALKVREEGCGLRFERWTCWLGLLRVPGTPSGVSVG